MRDLIRRLLDAVTHSGPAYQPDPGPARPSLALTGEPVHVWWGLDDVVLGDDGSVTVLLSGPTGEPYVLELDSSRAAALRDSLAGPEQPSHVQYGIDTGDGVILDPASLRSVAEARLTRYRDCWPDAVIMRRPVRYGLWAPVDGGEQQ